MTQEEKELERLLEKAAEEYAYTNWESDDYHEGAADGLPFDAIGHTAKCFIDGATWQKEQDKHKLSIDTLRVEYEKGRHDMLEELMSHSISGCYIHRNRHTRTSVLCGLTVVDDVFQSFKNRDKVRIIVVKEGGAE